MAYNINNDLTAGVNIFHDEAFDSKISADIKVRFGGPNTTAERKEVQEQPVIIALTSSPSNREVRVHDQPWWAWALEIGTGIALVGCIVATEGLCAGVLPEVVDEEGAVAYEGVVSSMDEEGIADYELREKVRESFMEAIRSFRY